LGKSLKNIPIVAIIFLYNSIAFAQQAIHLKCQSNVTQYSKMGKFENEFKFDLTITESNNFIEFSSSPSLAGGSIFLNTSPSSIIKYGQIKIIQIQMCGILILTCFNLMDKLLLKIALD